MPTTTWNVNKDARIADSGGTSLGAGASDYNPVGLYSGFLYRTLLGFSYSFSGMTSISSAILHMKTSVQNYVAFGSDPDIYVARLTSSWSEGTAVSLSGSNAVEWSNQPSHTNTNRALVDVPTTETTEFTVDITALIQDAFAAGVFYGVKLYAADEGTATDVTEIWAREGSTSHDPWIVVTYSTNTAPNAPTGLSPTADAVVNSLSPTFTGTFSDPNAGDTLSGTQVLLYADDGTTLIWDSGTVAGSGTSFSVPYSGLPLTGNAFYKWKARTKDNGGLWGAYSVLQRFKANSIPSSPTVALQESPTSDVKTLTPTFQLTHNDPDVSDSLAYKYQIILETSGGSAVWDSGEISLGSPSNSVTKLYNGAALSWQTSYRWKARTQDSNGAWSAYSSYQTFTTHTTGVPTSLSPTGSTVVSSTTPTLTGSRASSADTLASAQVQVYADDGTTLVWDSGTFTSGVTSTSFSKVVGTTLGSSTFYKWRARVTGSIGGTSSWSSLQRFQTPDATAPVQTTPLGPAITDTTPDYTFTRGTNFNRHELFVYSEDDGYTTPIISDTPSSYTATGSKTVTPATALTYGKHYRWKVRVSADGGSNWSPYAGPSEFIMDEASVPVLTAPISNSWQTTLTPTFQGNTQLAESIVTFRIILYAEDQTTVVWDSGDLAGSGTSFSKVYNGPALTAGARYFWKASYKKTGSIPGDYSALESFHINIAPNAPTSRVPATGYVYADDASPIAPTFEAEYSDGDKATWGDSPTKFEVEVARNSDGVVMYTLDRTTGLSGGINSMTDGGSGVTKTTGAGGANLSAEVEYKWRARYTDSKSAVGTWSSFNVFKPTQAPTVSISTPGATVGSPSFLIDWAFTSPASKSQSAYRVYVVRDSDSVTVYDTGKVASSDTQFTMPAGYLINGAAYTIHVIGWDSDDITSAEDTASTTADWTAPDPPGNFSAVFDPDTSTVILTWDESTLLAADFSYYQLYRRLPSDASWTKYATVTTKTVLTYSDYFAANGTLYDYKATVFQKVPGDVDLESPDSDISSVVLDADVWFVIGADRAEDHSFELPVTRAPFREPIQQETFEPLGSDRKTIVRGKVLGAEGTLELTFKEDEVTDAKRRIDYIKSNKGPHILKSPFGDVWLVEFSGPDKDYQMAGHMKVALAWTEVA